MAQASAEFRSALPPKGECEPTRTRGGQPCFDAEHAGPAREPDAELGHPKDERDQGDCKPIASWGSDPGSLPAPRFLTPAL